MLVCLEISQASHSKSHVLEISQAWTNRDSWSPEVDLRFHLYCKERVLKSCALLPLIHEVIRQSEQFVIWGSYTHFTGGEVETQRD